MSWSDHLEVDGAANDVDTLESYRELFGQRASVERNLGDDCWFADLDDGVFPPLARPPRQGTPG